MLQTGPLGSFSETPLPCAELWIIWWASEHMHRQHRIPELPFQDSKTGHQHYTTAVTAAKISWRVTKSYQQLQKRFNHKYTGNSITIYMDFAIVALTKTLTLATIPGGEK